MPYTVIMHIENEIPFLAEVEDIPDPQDNVIILSNPRQKDGRPITALDEDATFFIYPWSRVSFVEIIGEQVSRDELIEFFRDD